MTHSQPKRSLLDLSSPRYLLDALGGHLPPAADPNFDCLMADFPMVNSVGGRESRGAPVGGAGCSHVFGGLLTGRLRFRRRETGTAIRELPAAPRRSPGRCRALSMLPGSGPQTGSGPSGHPARSRPSGRLPGGPTPLVSLCGGFTARPGARGGGGHAEEGSMPTGGKRLSRSHGNERPSTPAALRSGDLTCSLSAVLSPPAMSPRSQWPSLGFCPASGLHHLLSIARARRGSPVGKPPLPPLAR